MWVIEDDRSPDDQFDRYYVLVAFLAIIPLAKVRPICEHNRSISKRIYPHSWSLVTRICNRRTVSTCRPNFSWSSECYFGGLFSHILIVMILTPDSLCRREMRTFHQFHYWSRIHDVPSWLGRVELIVAVRRLTSPSTPSKRVLIISAPIDHCTCQMQHTHRANLMWVITYMPTHCCVMDQSPTRCRRRITPQILCDSWLLMSFLFRSGWICYQ